MDLEVAFGNVPGNFLDHVRARVNGRVDANPVEVRAIAVDELGSTPAAVAFILAVLGVRGLLLAVLTRLPKVVDIAQSMPGREYRTVVKYCWNPSG